MPGLRSEYKTDSQLMTRDLVPRSCPTPETPLLRIHSLQQTPHHRPQHLTHRLSTKRLLVATHCRTRP